MSNIRYQTEAIARFFLTHRSRWEDLYPSERWLLARVLHGRPGLRVLDVGCAAGGLGLALQSQFELGEYCGVDVNAQAIAAAQSRSSGRFVTGDIVTDACFADEQFDVVCSLGCVDWNVCPEETLRACWSRVAPGGTLVLSLRLSPGPGVNDIARSYQPIVFDDEPPAEDCERANYVVLNWQEGLGLLWGLEPAPGFLLGYGYWGPPSKTAVTPYERLVFAVFGLRRGPTEGPDCELHLPHDLFGAP